MVKSFRHKGLKELFETGRSATVPSELRARCLRALDTLNRATHVREVVGLRTHPVGTNPTVYAVSVNGPWRILFEFESGDAFRVDLKQYH